MTTLLTTIAPLAASADVWLVDIWGVMHNGVRPFAEAVAACERFRATGGHVILVSNAPRPNTAVAAQLARIGVSAGAYDAIISSGDISRTLIAERGGQPLFHLGPERDLTLYEGLSVTLAPAAAAQVIVCTGLFDDERETPDSYVSILADAAARDLPMICANPDLSVERGGRLIPCAGAVAARYRALGGRVAYAGKPHPPIYEAAFRLAAQHAGRPVPKERMLAIGDGIKTDIEGAHAAAIRSVYIASKVHLAGDLDADALLHLFPDAHRRPAAAMTALAWP